jgi:hypothetical protein
VAAGNGVANSDPNDTGDGRPATQAQLSFPVCVAVDSAGNMYIADFDNNRVRKVDVNTGIITTLAGRGTPGNLNDGSAAEFAWLDGVSYVLLDASEQLLYVSDSRNNRIRRIYLSDFPPTIETFAADIIFPLGLAFDSFGTLYIAEVGTNKVRKVNPGVVPGNDPSLVLDFAGNGDPGPFVRPENGLAIDASFEGPTDVKIDRGNDNAFISWYQSRGGQGGGILRVDLRTGQIYNQADQAQGLATVESLSIDQDNNLWLVDSSTCTVSLMAYGCGWACIQPMIGGSCGGATMDPVPPLSAQLKSPIGVLHDNRFGTYVSDSSNNMIRRMLY